jgi:quinol monooxygenase YgiN
VAQAEPFFRADAGCTGFALQRVVEEPGVYHLVVGWTSVEAHNVGFRGSDNFAQCARWLGRSLLSRPRLCMWKR